jgi:hypothetical protein
MKKLLIALSILASGYGVMAQNEVDALRYSFLNFGGTARFMSTAGAFGALGADISTLHTNPGGIGLYKSNEVTFSSNLFYGKTESNYAGYSIDDYLSNFNIGSVGMVAVLPAKDRTKPNSFQNFQFGFNMIRNNNFHNQITTMGENTSSSLVDAWNEDANGTPVDYLNEYDTYLAYDTYLLNPDSLSGNQYLYTNAGPIAGVKQMQTIVSEGYMNEWAISLGANFDDKLYFGGTFGFPYLRYYETKSYHEDALSNDLTFDEFKSMSAYDYLDVRGHGFNFKFGIIYKPVEFMRLGFAVHTPTNFYHMEEVYSTSVHSSFDNGDQYSAYSPTGYFDYELTTPMRLIGSAAFVIGKYGFISADYEFVDYATAKFRSSYPEDFYDANNAIKQVYTSTGNLRIGGEFKVDKLSLRGGYAFYGSPFEGNINDGARTSYTFGLGFREGYFFADLAGVLMYADEDYYLYTLESQPDPVVKNHMHNQSYTLTFGVKF